MSSMESNGIGSARIEEQGARAEAYESLPARTTHLRSWWKRRVQAVVTALQKAAGTARRIGTANVVTIQTLWDAHPRGMMLRASIAICATAAPYLGWWGSAQLIDQLSAGVQPGGPLMSLLPGLAAFLGSFAMIAVIPVALSSLERSSDNITFEHIFGKFTRKMVTLSQEQLADPVLAETVKQVKERAVWRMMAMARNQPQAFRSIGTLVITTALVAWKAPVLVIVLILFGLPTMFFELRHAKRRAELEEQLGERWGALWGDLSNLMIAPALAMLHQFGAALWFAYRYRSRLRSASAEECRLEHRTTLSRCLAAFLVSLGVGICVWWLLEKTFSKQISVGEFVLLVSAISGLGAGLSELASFLGQQWSQSKSITEFTDFIANPVSPSVHARKVQPELEYGSSAVALIESKRSEQDTQQPPAVAMTPAALEFDNVWYRYPSAQADRFAVRELSFKIKPGSVVAIVGPNGAGKSSTMALLLKQLTATSGCIRINGESIAEMSAAEFNRQVVMMPQQLRHFNLSTRELLNLGRVASGNLASDKQLWIELERVGAAEFVRTWKDGLGTLLGIDRRGAIEPSGGQLQRLLLASVVVANRGLIVLDEPVSMVDPDAAKHFWDALFAETTGRTVIFSTHHLGAVRRVHKILFVEGGTVAAEGTHDELMERSARYRNLFNSQADDYR